MSRKAWLLLSKAGSNHSLRAEGLSLQSGLRRWRRSLRGMESTWRRFITTMDLSRTNFTVRGNTRQSRMLRLETRSLGRSEETKRAGVPRLTNEQRFRARRQDPPLRNERRLACGLLHLGMSFIDWASGWRWCRSLSRTLSVRRGGFVGDRRRYRWWLPAAFCRNRGR
jgi:hypothetical protein